MAISADQISSTPTVPQRDAGVVPGSLAGLHIGALDGVRGLAIILVLIFHYGRSARTFELNIPFLQFAEFGWVGVDLFFVLSGFLITGILFDSRDDKHFFRNFYARRALRIFPLYYFALLVVVVLSLFWQTEWWPTTNPVWIGLYLTNFILASDGPAGPGILAHYWSLAIEEHFYLVWPFIVYFLRDREKVMAAAVGLIVTALALRIGLTLSGTDTGAIYVLTPTRMDSLAFGALCALAVRGPGGVEAMQRPARILAGVSGAALLVLLLVQRSPSPEDPGFQTIGYTLIAAMFAGLIVIGIAWRPLNALLNAPLLRWFGKYSYGIYVWHVIINVLLFYTSIKVALGVDTQLEKALYLIAAFTLVLAVSLGSYHLMEKRFLGLKKYFH